MTSYLKISLVLFAISLPFTAFADEIIIKKPFSIAVEKETVTAITPDDSPIEQQQKNFTFDWNQQTTIAGNQSKVQALEKFLTTLSDVSKLNKEDRQALGQLFYKLGSYDAHVARNPDAAITNLTLAHGLLTDKQERNWTDNQLAYSYAQKYSLSNKSEDKEKGLYYANKVISDNTHHKNQATAFAYSIKGLIQINDKEFSQAETSLKTALSIYEKLPGGKDDQYIRTKSRLANALLGQQGREQQAITLLKQTKRYWSSKNGVAQSPYTARNLICLGQAYLQIGKPKEASQELKTAITIYQNLYGNNSQLLKKPYELLAEAYKNLGNTNQASAYQQKAEAIKNA